MTTQSSPVFGARLTGRAVDPDAVMQWGCSGKGWNCCIGKGITLRPYDLIGLARATETTPAGLINEALVTFSWYENGALIGILARRPYERGQEACVFYHDVTNTALAGLREEEPEVFKSLPPQIRRAADSDTPKPWRVAGLCGAHEGRPMVCRGFPFTREPLPATTPGALPMAEVREVHRCGTCALRGEATTPRAVLEGEQVRPYWLAADAFDATAAYLRALGLAQLRRPDYTALPVSDAERTELWASMFVPDSLPEIAAAPDNGWIAGGDAERDLALFERALRRTIDTAEALVEAHGGDRDALGFAGEPGATPPPLEALLDPGRELLPPRAAEATDPGADLARSA